MTHPPLTPLMRFAQKRLVKKGFNCSDEILLWADLALESMTPAERRLMVMLNDE